MPDKIHFISGLPRSGSTLLAAILRQNPLFHTDITGPLAALCGVLHERIGGTGEFSVYFNEQRCAQMLRGLFDTYYAHVPSGHLVFDTNRTWTTRAPLLGALYPNFRIICCVRDIGWILDSIERMRVRNPLRLSKIFAQQSAHSIYTRVDELMHSENGLVGAAWSGLREAWFSEAAHRVIVIPYDVLVNEPCETLRMLYRLLEEPYYEHDFHNVIYDAPEYDSNLGMPGLHTVHKVVAPQKRQPVIPPELFSKYAKSHFWNSSDLNPHGATVLQRTATHGSHLRCSIPLAN
jgi:sulfotransferase